MDDVSGSPAGTSTDQLLLEAARSAPAAQLLVDPAGRLVVASRRAEEELGVRPEDVGRPLRELDVARTPVELEPLLERVLETDRAEKAAGDSRDRCWEVVVAPLGGSAELGVSITFHDVEVASSKRRGPADARELLARALDDLRATGEELESASAALSLAATDSEGDRGPAPLLDRDLHHWAAGLRERSVSVRRQAARSRADDAPQREKAEPSFGDVPVTDLFVVLVENHRLEVREAVRRLMLGLLREGYPADADSVCAADAMAILESVLDEA